MSNRFTYAARPELPGFRASNGWTSTVVELLAVSASSAAATPEQARWAAFLASFDQTVVGRGAVSSDLSEWPWPASDIAETRDFLLRAIGAVVADRLWKPLGMDVDEVTLGEHLDALATLVLAFDPDDVDHALSLEQRWGSTSADPPRCARHRIYRHDLGCVLCHEEGRTDH